VIGDDGVVVLPSGLTPEVVAAQVAAGAELDGLYPPGERWREAYENWVKEHKT